MNMIHHELRLYGHRGASARLPENTLESFRLALADGANALELDVHLTADNRIVVAHDPDGRRMAGVSALVKDHTLADIKQWNVAVGFGVDDLQEHRMPSLGEVLDATDSPVSVDLKPDDFAIVDAVVEVVETNGAERRVIVGSFHTGCGDSAIAGQRLSHAARWLRCVCCQLS
jgi:glycerophosphoryl diester phosphodiesterase